MHPEAIVFSKYIARSRRISSCFARLRSPFCVIQCVANMRCTSSLSRCRHTGVFLRCFVAIIAAFCLEHYLVFTSPLSALALNRLQFNFDDRSDVLPIGTWVLNQTSLFGLALVTTEVLLCVASLLLIFFFVIHRKRLFLMDCILSITALVLSVSNSAFLRECTLWQGVLHRAEAFRSELVVFELFASDVVSGGEVDVLIDGMMFTRVTGLQFPTSADDLFVKSAPPSGNGSVASQVLFIEAVYHELCTGCSLHTLDWNSRFMLVYCSCCENAGAQKADFARYISPGTRVIKQKRLQGSAWTLLEYAAY